MDRSTIEITQGDGYPVREVLKKYAMRIGYKSLGGGKVNATIANAYLDNITDLLDDAGYEWRIV